MFSWYHFQIEQMKVKDERTKVCTEVSLSNSNTWYNTISWAIVDLFQVLNGIKLIKLYAWEEAFEENINVLRKKEVRLINDYFISLLRETGCNLLNNIPSRCIIYDELEHWLNS